MRGQQDFRTGLHRRRYHALRPRRYATHGVLVVRCRDGLALREEDLAARLEVNDTIDIHRGGKGMGRQVGRRSEGCQVVAGGGYRNHDGALVGRLDHVGIDNGAVADSRGRLTRGASPPRVDEPPGVLPGDGARLAEADTVTGRDHLSGNG